MADACFDGDDAHAAITAALREMAVVVAVFGRGLDASTCLALGAVYRRLLGGDAEAVEPARAVCAAARASTPLEVPALDGLAFAEELAWCRQRLEDTARHLGDHADATFLATRLALRAGEMALCEGRATQALVVCLTASLDIEQVRRRAGLSSTLLPEPETTATSETAARAALVELQTRLQAFVAAARHNALLAAATRVCGLAETAPQVSEAMARLLLNDAPFDQLQQALQVCAPVVSRLADLQVLAERAQVWRDEGAAATVQSAGETLH